MKRNPTAVPAAFAVICTLVVAAAMWLWQGPGPRSPFSTLATSHDGGKYWRLECATDPAGCVLAVDTECNLLYLAVSGGSRNMLVHIRGPYENLEIGTHGGEIITVHHPSNELYIAFARGSVHTFPLEPGAVERVKQRARAPDGRELSSDMVRVVMEHYEGPDADRVRELLEPYALPPADPEDVEMMP